MISSTSEAKSSSKVVVSTPWLMMSTATSFASHTANTSAQQTVFAGDDPPADAAFDDLVQQSLQAFLVVVHARTKIGNHLERPALFGAIPLQHLLLPLQIVFLVVTGNTGIGDGFTVLRRGVKPLWLESGKIIPALPSRCALRDQLALGLPSSQRRDRHTQCFRGFTDRYLSIHHGSYQLVMTRFQVNCSSPPGTYGAGASSNADMGTQSACARRSSVSRPGLTRPRSIALM